jgi:hypothetical protein
MTKLRLSEDQLKAWSKNLLKFTAVFLAALFSQLALGVTLEQAIPFALVILYAALADFFKKLSEE